MSKSQKRKRGKIRGARFSPEEDRIIAEKAKAYGGFSALIRTMALDAKLPKSRLDIEAMTKAIAATGALTTSFNRVGTNVNQIAKEDNMGRDLRLESLLAEWKEFKEIFERDQLELRGLFLRGLGLEPDRR